MKIIRDLTGYSTSRDYRALYELAKIQSVVCIADYYGGAQRDLDGNPAPVYRDVCQTIAGYGVQVSCRGVCYADDIGPGDDPDGVEPFVESCEAVNLEWVVPAPWPDHLPPPAELLRRALNSREIDYAAGEPWRELWGTVARLCSLGSTYSADLCRALGIDPSKKVGLTSWEAIERATCGEEALTAQDYEAITGVEAPPRSERYPGGEP